MLRLRFWKSLDIGLLHVKQIQQQNIRAHSGGKFCVGDVSQHRHNGADGLAGDGAALAAADGSQQVLPGNIPEI